jgi:SOS-response transcriptional repressor LexA
MAPILKPRDIIILSEKEIFKNGELCLAQLEGNISLIRYVHLQEKQYLLTSENSKNFPPQSFLKSKIKKIMRVMKIIRSL